MESNSSKMKLKFHLKSRTLLKIDNINKENIHIKKNILNNIKLKSKLKLFSNKEIKTQPEIKEESKENNIIPSVPKVKKQILRNHKILKKIPSTNYINSSSMNKIRLARTINYSSKKDKESKESSLNNNTFQESKKNKNSIVSLKHIKKHFFTTHLILPKPFWLCSGTIILDKTKNKNKNNNSHKNTISDMTSINSILKNNKGNNSNNNTTANTHKNSGKKNISNSFKKCKINLKSLSRKNSYKNNNYTKIKKISNICPIRKILNRNNSNNSIIIKEEETKNNNYSFMNKTQFHYDIHHQNFTNNFFLKNKKNPEDEYTSDILYNLLQEEREMKLKIDSSYFQTQPEINEKMRAILIDWLIDVNNKFNFTEETLHITINIIDTYLSLKKIKRCNLQLLGVTALFISCKENEIIFRRLKEYAYITDNAYNEQDIINMENDILKTLEFNILFPSALTFFEILCNNFDLIDKENKDDKNNNIKFNFGQFLIQSFYMSDNSLKYYASTIACSAMYIVMKFFKIKNYQVCYDKNLYNIKEKSTKNNNMNIIKECAKEIYSFIGELSKNNLNASIRNFSSEKYGNISKLVFGNSPLKN